MVKLNGVRLKIRRLIGHWGMPCDMYSVFTSVHGPHRGSKAYGVLGRRSSYETCGDLGDRES